MAFDYRVQNDEITDVLGSIFMALNMGNSRSGQFFTPFEVSYLMAKITAPAEHIIGGWTRKLHQNRHPQQTEAIPTNTVQTPTLPLLNQAWELVPTQLF